MWQEGCPFFCVRQERWWSGPSKCGSGRCDPTRVRQVLGPTSSDRSLRTRRAGRQCRRGSPPLYASASASEWFSAGAKGLVPPSRGRREAPTPLKTAPSIESYPIRPPIFLCTTSLLVWFVKYFNNFMLVVWRK